MDHRLSIDSRLLVAAAACLALLSASPTAATQDPSATMRDLPGEAIPSGQEVRSDQPLPPHEGPGIPVVQSLLASLQEATGQNYLVMGRCRMGTQVLRELWGKPAHQGMEALRRSMRTESEWRRWRGWHLLVSRSLLRHSTAPVSLREKHGELRRKITGVLASEDTIGLLTPLSRRSRVNLAMCWIDVTPADANRFGFGWYFAMRECEVDELMQLITEVTGDPWVRCRGIHVLSLSGKPLTSEQERQMAPVVASVLFKQSLTSAQLQRMEHPHGMPVSDLPRWQWRHLDTSTNWMEKRRGVPPSQLYLRRGSSDDRPLPFLEFLILTPEGFQRIGRLGLE